MSFLFDSFSLFLSPTLINDGRRPDVIISSCSHFNCINDDIIVPITYRLAYRLVLTIIVYTLVCGCIGMKYD